MSKDFDPYYQWLGIPPNEQPADHYRLLGVQRFEVDSDVISNAADRQMVFVRTFQQGKHSTESQKILNEIAGAKVCLLNPNKRADYDAQLRLRMSGGAPPSGLSGPPGLPPSARPVVAVARPVAQFANAADAPVVFDDSRRPEAGNFLQSIPWSNPAVLGGVVGGVFLLGALIYASGLLGGAGRVAEAPLRRAGEATTVSTPDKTGDGRPAPDATSSATSDRTGVPATVSTGESTAESATGSNPGDAAAVMGPGETTDARPTTTSGRRAVATNLSLAALVARPAFDTPMEHDYDDNIGYRSVWPMMRRSANLVRDLDPAKLSVDESWKRDGEALVSSEAQPAVLGLPFPVTPANRGLTIQVERLSGDDAFAIGVPIAGVDAVFVFGADGDTRSGLAMVDGTPLEDRNSGARRDDSVLPIGSPQTIQLTWNDFMATARVRSAVEGGPTERPRFALGFNDDVRKLGPSARWPSPEPGKIFLASAGSSFKVTKIEFTEDYFVGSRPHVLQQPEDLTVSPETADMVAGVWKPVGDALVLSESDGRSRVQLPVQIAQSYQVQLDFERLATAPDQKRVALGLVVGPANVMLSLDGPEGHGLTVVGGKFLSGDAGSQPLSDGLHSVQVRVLANPQAVGQFTVSAELDGRRIAEWTGEARLLETPANWVAFDPRRPWLGADCPTRFTNVVFSPIGPDGPSSAEPLKRRSSLAGGVSGIASSDPPAMTEPTGPTPTKGSGSPSMGVFGDREKQGIPSAAEVAVAQKQVDAVYDREIKGAKTNEDKRALAHSLLESLSGAGSDLASRYAILESARKWAAEGADAGALSDAITKLDESFTIDRWALTKTSFETAGAAAKTVDERAELATSLTPIIDSALQEGLLDAAVQLATVGGDIAGKCRDVELRKSYRELQDSLAALVDQSKAAAEAEKVLAQSPDDAEANMTVGKYLCLVKQDWAKGLPHLVKSKDEPLRSVALLEQTPPMAGDGDGAAKVADAWWDLSKAASLPKTDRVNYQLRSRYWYEAAKEGYQNATSQATAVTAKKIRIDKRLEEIANLNLEAGSKRGPRLPTGAEAGMIGRIVVRNRDVGVLVRYQPGRNVSSSDYGALLNQPAVVGVRGAVVQLDGFLRLPTAGKVTIRHICNSAAVLQTTLIIDGAPVNSVGDDLGKDESFTRDLSSGDHAIRWEIRGILSNPGSMSVSFADSHGRPLTLYYKSDVARQLRATPGTLLDLELGK